MATIKIGEYLKCGTYMNQPILWRCISIDTYGPLMVSDEILCFKEFDSFGKHSAEGTNTVVRDQYGSNDWSESNIRRWLNSKKVIAWEDHAPYSYADENGFLSSFRQSELQSILPVMQTTVPSFDTGNRRITTDRIFLLSTEQAECMKTHSDILGEDYVIGKIGKSALKSVDATEKMHDVLPVLHVGEPWRYTLRTPDTDDVFSSILGITSRGAVMPGVAYGSTMGIRPAMYFFPVVELAGDGTKDVPYMLIDNTEKEREMAGIMDIIRIMEEKHNDDHEYEPEM